MPILIGMFFSWVGCSGLQEERLTIAVSANMQYAMEELIDRFESQKKISCELIVGSSGKLTAQIMEGAPFHLFFSADMKYPMEIYNKGLAEGPPQVYAHGYVIFWSLNEEIELTREGLLDEGVRHIAMANPETAPYGRAAYDVLTGMGIYKEMVPKLVFGESVSQTNQFILSGSAEVGLTARSVVSSSVAEGKGHWQEADPGLYQPIEQGFVHLKKRNREQENWAVEFERFLGSQAAMDILHKFGYGIDQVK